MTKNGKISIALFALFALFATKGNAQMERIRNYVFANDSVAGFDEQAASVAALANASYGNEFKVFMYHAKRNYIKQKYNLKTPPLEPVTLFNNQESFKTTAIGGACDNEDFELATVQINAPNAVQGWLVQSGNNSGLGCNPIPMTNNLNYTVYVNPIIDPVSGLVVSSYFNSATNVQPSGNAFIRLNDLPPNATVSRLTKTFIVTPTNALFQYAYLPVIEDGSHGCCSQPGFDIKLTVTNTVTNASTVLACPQISVAVPSAACPFTLAPTAPVFTSTFIAATGSNWMFHNWAASAIDLTAYLGNQISIQITVRDCDQGGHTGYCYFDSKCAPMTVLGNNIPFPAGTPSINLPTCGLLGATICAPPGMGPYSWAGPGVIAPYTSPLQSNQCYSTGINADFTLTMNPAGSCSPIERVITVTITPAPYLIPSVVQAACGVNTAVVSYTAAGSASVNPVISFSPVPTSTAQSAVNIGTAVFPAGTGVVTITALDPLGCKATGTVNVNASPPNVTVAIQNVSGSGSITCLTPSVDLNAVSNYTLNPLNFYWSSSSFTANTQGVNITSPSTLISVLATDPNTGCSASSTIAIGLDQVLPVSSVNPVNQNILCGPGVVATATGTAINPTINVTHSWYSPGIEVPVSGGGQYSIFGLGGPGTYTHVLVNNVNGCSVSKTVQVTSNLGYPVFNVVSPLNSFTIGCASRSMAVVNIVDQNTFPLGGGSMSFAVLPPGFSQPTYTYSTILDYTLNAPGNYTFIVQDNNNLCETRITVPIVQDVFPPNATVNVPTRTLTCRTPSTILEGVSTNTAVSYSWSFQNGSNPNTVPNATTTVQANTNTAISATVINVYTLTVLNVNNQCKTTSLVPMYQNIRPVKPKINGAGPLDCNTYMQTLVNGSTLDEAPGFFAPLPTAVIKWDGPSPQVANEDTVASYKALTVGIYTMVVMDRNNGCITQTTVLVGDNRVYPVLQTNTLVALDCGASGINLSVTAVGLKASDVTASWNTPLPVPNIKNPNTLTLTTDGVGEYALSVTTNSNGCGGKILVEVVNGSLTAGFTPDQESGYAPLTVNFTNNSSSTSTITGTSSVTSVWSFGNGSTKTTTTNIGTSAVYTQPGTYTVTMFSSKGSCTDVVKKIIKVDIPSKLEVPNVFTPNGDNSNDIFFIKAANLSEITALIYDRWGNQVYELTTDKGNIAWDGKNLTGKDAPDGTYFYIITAKGKDGQSYDSKGTVSLYR